MQLVVVALVLPALVILARTNTYPPLRIAAAVLPGLAAISWLLDRLGATTVMGAAADSLGAYSPWILGALWLGTIAVVLTMRCIHRSWTRIDADQHRESTSHGALEWT
jgi:hypothetical protein